MKKSIYFCLFLAFICSLHAQIVTIPDTNFKAKLITLAIDTNHDGEIQNTEAEAVTTLYVDHSNISDLTGIEAFVNLDVLNCTYNSITSLDISPLINLHHFSCFNNQITNLTTTGALNLHALYCKANPLINLDVSNLINLTALNCDSCSLSTLDISNLINLTGLQCSGNQLTTLNVSNNPLLSGLHCYGNQLTTLDFSNTPFLSDLRCWDNQLTTLDFSNTPHLSFLSCADNQLTTIDVNNCHGLNFLFCVNNPLTTLFIKNGSDESPNFSCPTLQYICADESQLSAITQAIMLDPNMSNVYVNSLCTYELGGNYNTISGNERYDSDTNGCTVADSTYPYLTIAVTDGINTDYVCSNNIGNYKVFVDSGTYTLTPQFANPSYFSTPISPSIYFPNDSNNLQTQDFCIIPNGVFPDVEITLIPPTTLQPGFDAEFQLLFRNKGTTMASGNITFDFIGNKMTFVSSFDPPISQTTNQLTWNYTNLQPFENRGVIFTLNVLPPPTNNIGEQLNFSANIALANDTDTLDNQLNFSQTIVGSFDPNDKTCLEGNLLHNDKIGDYLHYFIRFQNTGNFPADHVVIVDSIDINKFDINSLQILETSHTAHIDISNGILQFYFENIQLADSFTNEPASHGYVLYKIKTNNNLAPNSTVKNKADIYFDYNAPIVTNEAITTFSNLVNISNPTAPSEANYKFYPNPAQTTLTIEVPQTTHFTLYNQIGQAVIKTQVDDKKTITINDLPNGLYILKANDASIGKMIVKE